MIGCFSIFVCEKCYGSLNLFIFNFLCIELIIVLFFIFKFFSALFYLLFSLFAVLGLFSVGFCIFEFVVFCASFYCSINWWFLNVHCLEF